MRLVLHEPRNVLAAIVLNLAVLLGVCLLGIWIADGAEPRYEKITHYGCKVTQTKDFNNRWQLHVWADYQGEKIPPTPHDFEALYSVRETRRQILRDCDRWMGEVVKHLPKN